MAAPQKDTIYIDIDDEITSIINKLRASEARIIALVLPKRATMLQSTVNMKLLKKAAEEAKKRLVLITAETGLLPLAGSVGLYVARTLQSKPEIPEAPRDEAADNVVESVEAPEEDFNSEAAAEQPVGELAGLPEEQSPKAKPELTPRPVPKASEPDEAIEIDNTADKTAAAGAAAAAGKAKKRKDKKLKVPNFNLFRKRLVIAAAALIVLIVAWILADAILPKATITIASKTDSVNSSLTVALSTGAATLNKASLTVPAHLQQTQKTQSQQVPTTGQKNEGTKATGSIVMTAGSCSGTQPSDVVAGSGVSTGGFTYITSSDASFVPVLSHGKCVWEGETNGGSNNISITAQSAGSAYNTSNASFAVSGRSDVSASGSASGGTDNNVQVVSQADIDSATKKLTSQDTSSIKTELQNDLQQAGYYAIPATFNTATPSTSTSANVGDPASSVTVTQTITYTMFGAQKSDLKTLLDSDLNSQIDTAKQSIIDDGFNHASFNVLSQSTSGAQLAMQATGTAGPHLDLSTLKAQVAGKKPGDVQALIANDPGVTGVKVHLSPFWVSSVPKKTGKITITFQNTANAKSS